MKPVLIIATRYDRAASCLYGWAEALRSRLLSSGKCDACLMLDGEGICRSGSSLVDAIDRVEYLVFFGHGEKDQWIALPAGNKAATAALVDVATVNVLNGRTVYSACCYALSALGFAFKTAFSGATSPPEFVGYQNAFNVHLANESYFRDVVNDSVFDFIVNGRAASTVVTNQQAEWNQLDGKFSAGGTLSSNPDAWVTAANARDNAISVGHT
jgi:hypothetical protein